MATSTSASSSSMSGDSMSMSMADMAMTFFEAFQTPLFADAWKPTSKGQYAGTCIFLIALACTLRLLLALKPILEDRFWRNYTIYDSNKDFTTSNHGGEIERGSAVVVMQKDLGRRWAGWRASAAAARATYEVIVGGVGYLLYVNPPPSDLSCMFSYWILGCLL